MNRRLFLTQVLQGSVGGLCLAQSGLAASVLERRKLSTVGMQLYTVRRELERDFAGTLARVAALGFREVEFAGYFGQRPTEVKALLTRHGLTAPASHVTLAALRGDLREMIDAAHVIGHQYILVAYLPAEDRQTLDDYQRLADLFNRAGAQLKREGIQFAYHNHDFEFAPLNGQVPYDLVLARTDSQTVKLELDLYWMVKAGQSPLKYFAKHPGRYQLLHVKDMDATTQHGFTEVGRGVIDFKTIFAHSGQAGVKHFFVEQDETPGPPFDSLKVSLDYLKRLTF